MIPAPNDEDTTLMLINTAAEVDVYDSLWFFHELVQACIACPKYDHRIPKASSNHLDIDKLKHIKHAEGVF